MIMSIACSTINQLAQLTQSKDSTIYPLKRYFLKALAYEKDVLQLFIHDPDTVTYPMI